MVSVYVDNERNTQKLTNWSIRSAGQGKPLSLVGKLPSGEWFSGSLDKCVQGSIKKLNRVLLIRKGSSVVDSLHSATVYGDKYVVVQYLDGAHEYVYKAGDVELVEPASMKESTPFQYFVAVANARIGLASKTDQRTIAENIVRQFGKLPALPDTALHAYCTGQNTQRNNSEGFIFPFGLNESQLKAVERAFTSQISLIEGPPGTGKTQTILNIIANILVRGKTVAIVSNNNPAVQNVYEKLGKFGLGHLVAQLGNNENRQEFFRNLPALPQADFEFTPLIGNIQFALQRLKGYLNAHNRAAILKVELDELEIERRYLQEWQSLNGAATPTALGKYKLSAPEATDLMAYMAHLADRHIRFHDRLELMLNFGIFRTSPFKQGEARQSAFYSLQLHFYDRALEHKHVELHRCQTILAHASFDALLETLTAESMKYLKYYLSLNIPQGTEFTEDGYSKDLDAFLTRFPIVGSSTHSLVNSLKKSVILDYVIIDEASQQDIVPGVLALGCARNLIIVGDRNQLAHIPAKTAIAAPADGYDCEKNSLLDSCVAVFGKSIPVTLLKEHYRCHPRIIQFCNQQFYNNQLVAMTQGSAKKPLELVVTSKGNHTRKNANLRELESLLAVLDEQEECAIVNDHGVGFIAPFRNQISLSEAQLPDEFIKNTVHKFQGRECDEIVFSTVLDQKRTSQALYSFVDDPRMINVAVSRAKHRFILVTGENVFTPNNGPIAALTRYIEYYAESAEIWRAPVISAFDLLYKEYDQSLERLNARLRPTDSRYKSEQIATQILREILSQQQFQEIDFHSQVRLEQLVSVKLDTLTERERSFMGRASCDLVVYFKVGKKPLGVIEVDGGWHDTPIQAARDAQKNGILEKANISLLRLRTVEGAIERRIAEFLAQWAAPAR